mgnify:CR=1 FL=1
MKRGGEGLDLYPSLATVAAYALITLAMTFPLGLRLGTHLFSSTNDFWIYPWNNWWVKRALTQGYGVYHTPYLFYPLGAGLVWHGFSWFNTLVWLPLQAVLGALAAHNVTILLTYVVAGYTAYLLAYEITGSRPAAFVAGLVYAFYPHRYAHRGQLKLLSNQWIPLAAFYLVRLTRRSRLRDGLGLGVALVLCGLCGWHQLFLVGAWGAMWLVYDLAVTRRQWTWHTARSLLLGGLVCLFVLAPLLVPMVTELIRTPGEGLEPSTMGREKRTDLLAFLLPPRDHLLSRIKTIARFYENRVRFEGPTAAIGWVSLLLAGWGTYKRRKAALPWFLSAAALAILALGSHLQVNGRALPILLPYALLRPTLLGTFLRHPNRFNIILALPISVLVALGWEAARERWAFLRRRGRWATWTLAVLILSAYCTAPVPTVQEPVSPFYGQLREEEGQFAVADFPIDLGRDKYYLYVQTLHERPIIGGHVSRPPENAHDFIEKVPILTAGRESPPEQGQLDDVSRQLRSLARADVRYVMIHKDRSTESDVEAWRRWFGFRPVYEDERVIAYRTDPVFGQDFEFKGSLEDGIGLVSGEVAPTEVVAGGIVDIELLWGTRREPTKDWSGEITLLSDNGEVVDRVTLDPFTEWVTSEWGSNALARKNMALRVSPSVPGGRYRVALSLADGTAAALIFDEIEVRGMEQAVQGLDVERRMAIPFGRELQFLGYAVERHGAEITVTWHWQALRDVETSYKLFLHLYDSNSGALVSQRDVIPGNWSYPTTRWAAGEIVSDKVSLLIEEVPSGTYQLAVGAYDAQTGRRLPVSTSEASAVADNVAILQEVVIP